VTAYLKNRISLSWLTCLSDRDKGASLESASVSILGAPWFTRQDVGQHGLPLLGFADWNDTVNLPAGAESLFTANLYGKALLEMIALLDYLGDGSAACERLHTKR
jgi:cellobiose phosphorylase